MGDNKLKLIVGVMVLVVAIPLLVFLYSKKIFPFAILKTPSYPKALSLDHTAAVRANIIKRDGLKVQIQNSKKQSEELPLSPTLLIYSYPTKSSIASVSADLNIIQPDQEAILQIEFKDGKYQVASISYFPPVPPQAPTLGIPLSP